MKGGDGNVEVQDLQQSFSKVAMSKKQLHTKGNTSQRQHEQHQDEYFKKLYNTRK
jgi:hypothetical protein